MHSPQTNRSQSIKLTEEDIDGKKDPQNDKYIIDSRGNKEFRIDNQDEISHPTMNAKEVLKLFTVDEESKEDNCLTSCNVSVNHTQSEFSFVPSGNSIKPPQTITFR